MNTINYKNISKTIDHFVDAGFTNIEVPWMATEAILNVTKPSHIKDGILEVKGKNKGLLASGEQGFLYLANKGFLQPGKYVTTTPCFRDDVYDNTHSKQFLKVEAIIILKNIGQIAAEQLDFMIDTAKNNFEDLTSKEITVLKTDECYNKANVFDSYDLCVKQNENLIEIGSYGIRDTDFCSWIYGTGIAEPRFSKVTK